MEKLKEIRVALDSIKNNKLILYKDNENRYIRVLSEADGIFSEISSLELNYTYSNRYSEWSDDDYINDWLKLQKNKGLNFNIIQDPWSDTIPIVRNFGKDPYYLNDGSVVYIKWYGGDGYEWSDPNGNELNEIENNDKSSIRKIVSIKSIDNLTLKENSIIEDKGSLDKYEFAGYMSDISILNLLLDIWKSNVSNHPLSMCSPNNTPCNFISYKSPILEDIENKDIKPKKKLNIKKPFDLKIRPNENFSIEIEVLG